MASLIHEENCYELAHEFTQFKKGDRIVLHDGRAATVKFEGSVYFSDDYFVGIALDEPTGKHDGRCMYSLFLLIFCYELIRRFWKAIFSLSERPRIIGSSEFNPQKIEKKSMETSCMQ